MILLGGPCHRRVYRDGEKLPAGYVDSGRVAKATLDRIFAGKIAAEVRQEVPRVFEWSGTDRALGRGPSSEGFARACTYRGCEKPATLRLEGPLERRPWYGCPEHAGRMREALSMGHGIDYSVDATPLRR